jgi:hypothetical protein
MDSLFRRAVCLRVSSLCRSRAALCIAVVALATVVAAPASAATLTWGFSGGGGNGPWASVGPNNNWWNGTARVAWTGGYNDMWFTGQPGTVSVYINGYATANPSLLRTTRAVAPTRSRARSAEIRMRLI